MLKTSKHVYHKSCVGPFSSVFPFPRKRCAMINKLTMQSSTEVHALVIIECWHFMNHATKQKQQNLSYFAKHFATKPFIYEIACIIPSLTLLQ